MHPRSAARAFALSVAAACSFDAIDYTGKACGPADGPCPDGWTCDAASGVCARDDAASASVGGGNGSGGAGAAGGACTPAPEACLTPAVDDDCDGVANDHCAVWSVQVKTPGSLQLPFDVAIDPVAGTVVAAGQSTAGNDDVMVVALTADGEPMWTLDAGDTTAPQEVQGVTFDDAGDVILAGFFRGTLELGADTLTSAGIDDVFVTRLSPEGVPAWAVRFGGAQSDVALAVAISPLGGLVISGNFTGTSPFGGPSAGGFDAFVARLDAQGGLIWSRAFGGSGADSADQVRVTADGDIVAVGVVDGTVDFGDGEVVTDGPDAFAAVWSDDGVLRWARTFTGPLEQEAKSVAVDATGDVYLAGTFEVSIDLLGEAQLTASGTRDAFVARLAADGASHVWSRGFGAYGAAQSAASVAVVEGDLFVAGTMDGPVDFGGGKLVAEDAPDVFVLAMDTASGDHRWSRRFGLSGNQGYRGVAMQAGPAGLVLTGDLGDGSVDFGDGVITAADPGDAFVAKWAP